MFWTILAQLATAARLFLEMKLVSAKYDLQRRIDHDALDVEKQIDALRAAGRADDADRLRNQFARRVGIVSALPAAPDAPPAGGQTGANP